MADENTNNEVSNQELEFTGNTVTLTETVNYTESERKDNAMILAEKMTQLENLKEEYNQLIIDNNNAIREMRADIEELEQEISDIRDGVVTGTAEVTNEYDEYETETQRMLIPKNEVPSIAIAKQVINKTEDEILQFRINHNLVINNDQLQQNIDELNGGININPVNPINIDNPINPINTGNLNLNGGLNSGGINTSGLNNIVHQTNDGTDDPVDEPSVEPEPEVEPEVADNPEA